MIRHPDLSNSSKLLKTRLERSYGPIAKTSWGKPYFVKENGMDLSIAHDGEITIAIATAGKVGIDIIHLPLPVLFEPEELSELFEPVPTGDEIAAFWAAREAHIKCFGTSLDQKLTISRNNYTIPQLTDAGKVLGRPLEIDNAKCHLFAIEKDYVGAIIIEPNDERAVMTALRNLGP